MSPSTVTIDENGILNTVSIDRITLDPTSIIVPDVTDDANGNNDGFPTDLMRNNEHKRYAKRQNLIYDKIEETEEVTSQKYTTSRARNVEKKKQAYNAK